MDLLHSKDTNEYFTSNGYNVFPPYSIVNERDTVFTTAGIQPLIRNYLEGKLDLDKKYFVPQSVIRTQFFEHLSEGTSLAFINGITTKFNLSETEYNKLVSDYVNYFYESGLTKERLKIVKDSKLYKDSWNDINITGNRTFYYYDDLEIGDTTFFTNVSSSKIETFCDLGFGLERLRWCQNKNKSYFDLYSDSKETLIPRVKGLISAISLLTLCDVKTSNKGNGYQAKKYFKNLVKLLNKKDIEGEILKYFNECITYWRDWQKVDDKLSNTDIITKVNEEYSKNCMLVILMNSQTRDIQLEELQKSWK
ncbi:MAG: hypothetical protein ACI31R_01150 [Bacilli bacterium]